MTFFPQSPQSTTSFSTTFNSDINEHSENILMTQKLALPSFETLRNTPPLITKWVPGEHHYTVCFPPEFEGTKIAVSKYDSRS